ncbi:putative wsc domain-containing protein [Phaeomoniella chlamydospora]|uniref:Putative wsc domain-containing protein n=1 Tax=Phaeomoniella chlamydospora TaxID=158046 RepID=A0A0G2GWA0_PHACM|nr:putative wsc domain-containing protein [Phaeomoniella chlamydospora]
MCPTLKTLLVDLVALTYGGEQILFLASSKNYIRTLNAKTGDLINERRIHTPFLQSDIGCTDIPNYIGIIGTPTIDTATDIVYFYSKTYIPNYRIAGDTGVMNGVYYFHGVDIKTLEDVDGYPILFDGSVADNDDEKYFIGGVILQRPSLVQIDNYIFAGFGGHCDLFNYTGLVVGIDITAKKIVSQFATESGPLAQQTNVWNDSGGGGQGGIWQSGMSLSTDGSRIFFVTGNGNAHENSGVPASGSSGCQTLGEAVVNLAVGEDGSLTLTDYFQPYDYENMDAGDQDFGSGGIALLDSSTFSGTGVSRIGVTSGKNGKIYILNADNLGGYRMGSGQTDGILQTIVTGEAVFGGAGSYPLEGGWIYSTPVGYPTYAYQLGFTSAGVPKFTQTGQTSESSAGRVGVGIPTVTSLDGQEGTAILWMTDPDAGLRAWYAVPDSSTGLLKTISLPQVNGLNKFERPVFGDTRLYVIDSNGIIYCLGSPVNLPLNCTSPVSFGEVALGSEETETVTCTAIIDVTSVDGLTVGDSHFEASNASLPIGEIKAGESFSLPVTWDLTNVSVTDKANASYGNTYPGVKSTALTLYTTNAVTGYSTVFPISLTGTEVSNDAFLETTTPTVDFGGVVITNDSIDAIDSTLVIENAGLSPLTITGYAFTTDELDEGNVYWTNITCSDGSCDLGTGFTSSNLPDVGTVIAATTSISVDLKFCPIDGVGAYSSYFQIWSDGGSTNTILEGSASTAPIANFSISNGEGGWLPPSDLTMDFGDVDSGSTTSRQIRICNNGGSVLTITKSKPPLGVIHVQTYGVDLHESQTIEVGECAYGTVLMVAPTTNLNTPPEEYTNEWTLNTDDVTFGVHVVEMTGTVISTQVGPTDDSGDAIYEYLGCYLDNDPTGRLLPYLAYDDSTNENGECQTACYAKGYIFAGTEYQTQCWCGNTAPSATYNDTTGTMCTFACAGDGSQACGGTGGYISIYYDDEDYDPGDGNSGGDGSSDRPYTVPTVLNYNYLGCYSEGTDGRALSDYEPTEPDTGGTLEYCAEQCQGYTYWGVEYSNECYCGDKINTGSVNQTSSDPTVNGCDMVCGGNESEYCGGANHLDVYVLNTSTAAPTSSASPSTTTSVSTSTDGPHTVQTAGTWTYLGCYTEGTNTRALNGRENPIVGADVSVEACTTACEGLSYAGVEYGGECYCGDTFGTGSVIVSGDDPASNGCNMVCNANSSEYCGGSNRLDVYVDGGGGSSSSFKSTSSSAALTITTSASATPISTGPITVQSVGLWSYIGCYSEGTSSRALSGLADPIAAADNDVEACTIACAGYTYAGVEYSGECYCGDSLAEGSTQQDGTDPDTTGCSMVCNGNSSEYCGEALEIGRI